MTIESLKALCEKATDGPWENVESFRIIRRNDAIDFHDRFIGTTNDGRFTIRPDVTTCAANAALIVALRNNAAALIEVAERAKELTRDCHYCGGAGTVTIMSTGSELIRGKIVPIPTAKREEPCQYCGDVRAALSKLEAP